MNNGSPAEYTRLPGRRFGVIQRSTLWLGADHLLVVQQTMTGESYRRFFFRDIRAISIRPTQRREQISTGLFVLVLFNLMPLLFLAASEPGTRAVALFALGSLVWGGLILANVLRGPACETRISTPAQQDIVPPLSRLSAARRVRELLRPRILAAQAEESAAEPSARTAESS